VFVFYLNISWFPMKFGALHVISGFRRKLDGNSVLLGHYAACSGKFFGTPYRFHLQGSKGPIGCPETSVRSYNYTLRNDPEERSSQVWWSYQSIFLATENTCKFTKLHTSKCEYSPLLHSSKSCRWRGWPAKVLKTCTTATLTVLITGNENNMDEL